MTTAPPKKESAPPPRSAENRNRRDSSSLVVDHSSLESASLLRIHISELQARRIARLLDSSKQETKVEGVFATVGRCFRSEYGGSVLELQVTRFSREATLKIQRIISEETGGRK